MTRALARECATPGCVALAVDAGRCADHPRQPWQRAVDHHQLLTATGVSYRSWRRARGLRLKTDRGRCVACGSPAAEVDHIVRLVDGGSPLSQRNLQSLCQACHQAKTLAERRPRGRGVSATAHAQGEPRHGSFARAVSLLAEGGRGASSDPAGDVAAAERPP